MFRTKKVRLTKAGKNEALVREVFVRSFLHFVGNDAESYGQPFELEPWVKENIWYPIFGTGKMEGGKFTRLYKRALIGVPRGVGKTVTACAMLLAEATMNPIHNGQYGLIADSEDNAQNAFEILATMVRLSPELSKTWEVWKKEIRNTETGAWIRTFPNKVSALQGWHFNFAICDEVHVYKDNSIWEAVVSGQARIPNAFALAITTASGQRKGFLWDWFSKIQNEGEDGCYCYWVGLDDSDKADDRRAWKKLMVTPRITMEQLEGQKAAMTSASFERYQLNRFPMEKAEEPFMRRRDVNACSRQEGAVDKSRWFAVGLDGAVSGDTLSVVAAQQTDEGTWAFEEYNWDVTGQMGVYDLTDVADVLELLARAQGRPLIVCDPARLQFTVNWLNNNRGIELFKMPQTSAVMCPASELLASAVRRHTCAFANTPVLAEHCINAVAAESKAYGRRLASTSHGKGSERIDAAIAGAMAMSAYDSCLQDRVGSYAVATIELGD